MANLNWDVFFDSSLINWSNFSEISLNSFLVKNRIKWYQISSHCSLVNVGFLFRAVWSLVKSFIDPKTQAKINLLKSTYTDDLLALVDAENLPHFFGGKCKCTQFIGDCLGSDIGPWNPEGGISQGGQTTRIQQ